MPFSHKSLIENVKMSAILNILLPVVLKEFNYTILIEATNKQHFTFEKKVIIKMITSEIRLQKKFHIHSIIRTEVKNTSVMSIHCFIL